MTTWLAILYWVALFLFTGASLTLAILAWRVGKRGVVGGLQGTTVALLTLMAATTGVRARGSPHEGFLSVVAESGYPPHVKLWLEHAGPDALTRLCERLDAGEYAGAAVYMAEHAPDDRRGFWGSFLEFGTLLGFSMAAILVTGLEFVVGSDGMADGWWRLPFLLTLPLGFVALLMRAKLHDSDTFKEAQEQDTRTSAWQTLRDLVTQQPKQLLKIMGITVLINTAFYLVLTYMPTYLSGQLGHSTAQGNWMLVAIMALMLVAIPPMGALSDRIGRKPLLLVAAGGYMLLSVPSIMLLGTPSLLLQFLGLAVLGILLVILVSSVSSTLPALFPTYVRYSGFAIGYNFSTAFFAGPSQTVANQLIETTGNQLVPGWYMAIAGLIGFISILCMRETSQATLRGEELPGVPESLGAPKPIYVEQNREDAEARRASYQA